MREARAFRCHQANLLPGHSGTRRLAFSSGLRDGLGNPIWGTNPAALPEPKARTQSNEAATTQEGL